MEELSYNFSRLSKIHENIIGDIGETADKYTTFKYIDLLENMILEYQEEKYNNTYRENKQVNELKIKVGQMNEKLKQYQQTIDTKNRQLAEYDDIIKNKNEKLKTYQQTIDNKNNKINAYIKTVEKREKVIENLEEKLKQKE
jgi:methyl-accepting chemotaxis protein